VGSRLAGAADADEERLLDGEGVLPVRFAVPLPDADAFALDGFHRRIW
jgi:hypothetical protein